MPDPMVTGGIIGGTVTAVFWGVTKLIPVVAKIARSNGKNSNKNNMIRAMEGRPGKAQVCIERGTVITKHDEIIKNLAEETQESKVDRKEIKTAIRTGLERIYDKLEK